MTIVGGMQNTWLLLLLFTRLSLCDWPCGGVYIDEDKQCQCGRHNLTSENDYKKRQCCGRDTCYRDEVSGHGICKDGIVCDTSGRYPWNCGDVMIAREKTCQCGSSSPPLTFAQYDYPHHTWCCPSEPCTYLDDGTAVCHNATILQGQDKGCNGGVCYDRSYLPCKSGNQCVSKRDICHGAPVCDDGSDVDMCGPDNDDLCPPDYHKCSAITLHQECYFNGVKNNGKYDCIIRGDESTTDTQGETVVQYDTIRNCIVPGGPFEGQKGLWCGSECLYVGNWCIKVYHGPPGIPVTCTTFTSDNADLCQNKMDLLQETSSDEICS